MKITRRQLRQIIQEEVKLFVVESRSYMGASVEDALKASEHGKKTYYVKDDSEVITFEKGHGNVNPNDTEHSVEAANDGDIYYQGT